MFMSVRKEIQSCTLKKSIIQAFLVHLFTFNDKFKDFKVDNTIFEKLFYPKNTVLEISEIAI
jgi:myosin-crossreactive antigen